MALALGLDLYNPAAVKRTPLSELDVTDTNDVRVCRRVAGAFDVVVVFQVAGQLAKAAVFFVEVHRNQARACCIQDLTDLLGGVGHDWLAVEVWVFSSDVLTIPPRVGADQPEQPP